MSEPSSTSKELVQETETIYEGRIVNLYLETVVLPNGKEALREVIRHGGAVAIVPLHEDGQISLVRQFRLPAGTHLLEIPAGTLEPGEDPLTCAERELQEEVGLFPGKLTSLGGIFLAPGYSSEYIHLYAASELSPSILDGDDDEFLEVVKMPLEDFLARIDTGEVQDAKTIAAVLRAVRLQAQGEL